MGDDIERIYSEYIHKSRYAKYLHEEKRRETWPETVDRYTTYTVRLVQRSIVLDDHRPHAMGIVRDGVGCRRGRSVELRGRSICPVDGSTGRAGPACGIASSRP